MQEPTSSKNACNRLRLSNELWRKLQVLPFKITVNFAFWVFLFSVLFLNFRNLKVISFPEPVCHFAFFVLSRLFCNLINFELNPSELKTVTDELTWS